MRRAQNTNSEMKKEELKQLSADQLAQQLAESTARLAKMQFAHAITPLENPMQLRALRKDIARLHTETSARKNAKA